MARFEAERIDYVQKLLDSHPEARVEDTYVAARLLVSTVELVVHQLIAEPTAIDVTRLENEMVAMLTRYATGGGEG